ncbi:hypothetical protein ACPCXF_05440 [Lysinibacillus agricola]
MKNIVALDVGAIGNVFTFHLVDEKPNAFGSKRYTTYHSHST